MSGRKEKEIEKIEQRTKQDEIRDGRVYIFTTITYATEHRTTADRQTEVDFCTFVTLMLGAHTRSCTLYLVLAQSL